MFIVVSAGGQALELAPANLPQEVAQNVRTILATRKGSVPYDRRFGLDWRAIDKPMPAGRAQLTVDVIDAIEYGEPRCRVTDVAFAMDPSNPGRAIPTVRIEIPGWEPPTTPILPNSAATRETPDYSAVLESTVPGDGLSWRQWDAYNYTWGQAAGITWDQAAMMRPL